VCVGAPIIVVRATTLTGGAGGAGGASMGSPGMNGASTRAIGCNIY
jgi:hypothetical protein